MLYYLFDWLEKAYSFPGARLFQYISFRTAAAIIVSLIISLVIGKRVIQYLQLKQVGEIVRNLGLEGQIQKQGTPTMGGIIIIAAIVIPVLLFAKLENIYVIIMLITTIWLGIIGFVDDYIKVFKKDKKGLSGKFKILGQVILGLIVGLILFFHPQVVIKEKAVNQHYVQTDNMFQVESYKTSPAIYSSESVKSTKTTIPFVKNNELDYADALSWLGDGYEKWAWLIFIPIIIFIITTVSNFANLTDGLDVLSTGTSAVIVVTL